MRTIKTGRRVFYKFISRVRENKKRIPKERPNIAPGKRLFDAGDAAKINDSKLSRFYKAMDLAG